MTDLLTWYIWTFLPEVPPTMNILLIKMIWMHVSLKRTHKHMISERRYFGIERNLCTVLLCRLKMIYRLEYYECSNIMSTVNISLVNGVVQIG